MQVSSIPTASTVFLQKLNKHIEKHLSDATLNVERLARHLDMSRSELHRKLAQSVGMSPSDYLCFVRLHHASQLLLDEPDWSINRVAHRTGFDDVARFSKKFKEVFEMTPTAFRKVYFRLRPNHKLKRA